MAPGKTNHEITHEFSFFRVFNDVRVQMKLDDFKIPPYDDPFTGVHCKDVTISFKPKITARIFKPTTKDRSTGRRLPLILYVHGCGFCRKVAFAKRYHIFLTHMAAEAKAIFVTFNYGGFPNRPLTACYDDSWLALQWVLAHSKGDGPESLLSSYGDFERFFICGNSSGANIAHSMATRIGREGSLPPNVRWVGLGVIQHVLAGCSKAHDDLWEYLSGGCKGSEDPRQNVVEEELKMINCERVFVAVGGDDVFKDGGIKYFEGLGRIGWEEGRVDFDITQGQYHSFFTHLPNHEDTLNFIKRLASFINREEANPRVQVRACCEEVKISFLNC